MTCILFILFVVFLIVLFIFGFVILVEFTNTIREKKKVIKKDIRNRFATISYYFIIYKNRGNEKYYLNNDENFYTSLINVKEYEFKTEGERKRYIDNNINRIKIKYGNDIRIELRVKKICIGNCKKLEECQSISLALPNRKEYLERKKFNNDDKTISHFYPNYNFFPSYKCPICGHGMRKNNWVLISTWGVPNNKKFQYKCDECNYIDYL